MVIGEMGWLIGVHLVMSLWLGLLASAWKGRSTPAWVMIGLATSALGLLMLARMPRLTRRSDGDMHVQHLDGTSLLN